MLGLIKNVLFFSIFSMSVLFSSAALSQNLLTNGDFEGSRSPWIFSGLMKYTGNNPSLAASGSGHIHLTSAYRTKSEAYQDVRIPARGAILTYMIKVEPKINVNYQIDWYSVGIRALDWSAPSVAKTYTNMTPTNGSYYLEEIDLSSFAGKAVRISFGGNSGSLTSSYSTYRVDAVVLRSK